MEVYGKIPQSHYSTLSVRLAYWNASTAFRDGRLKPDDPTCWANRKDHMLAVINTVKPDVLAMTEVNVEQVRYLEQALPNHYYTGRTINLVDGYNIDIDKVESYPETPYYGGFVGAFIHRDFTVIDTLVIPLPFIIEEQQRHQRILVALHLQRENEDFWVFVSHYDHLSRTSREISAKLEVAWADVLSKHRTVVSLGDKNAFLDRGGAGVLETLQQSEQFISCSRHEKSFVGYPSDRYHARYEDGMLYVTDGMLDFSIVYSHCADCLLHESLVIAMRDGDDAVCLYDDGVELRHSVEYPELVSDHGMVFVDVSRNALRI